MGYFKKLYTAGVKKDTGVYFADEKVIRTKLREYVQELNTEQGKKLVLRRAAAVVAYKARRLDAPRSGPTDRIKGQDYHTFYSGSGDFKNQIKIYKGNLLKSTKYYFTKFKEYEIGPRVLKRALPEFGKTVKTSSGFYAAMIFGKAFLYRQRILEPLINDPEIFTIIEQQFKKAHEKTAKKTGF